MVRRFNVAEAAVLVASTSGPPLSDPSDDDDGMNFDKNYETLL